MGHFKDLKAYQHARRLVVVSKPVIARLPERERDLGDQWRRASQSVVLNIAEGAGRRGPKEFRRFLDVARGSLQEIEAILDVVVALDYFPPGELDEVINVRDECARTVFGLIRKFAGMVRS